VVDRTDHGEMFGLSYGDTNQDYTDIDYALEMASGGTLKIHEKGTYRGSFGLSIWLMVQPNPVGLNRVPGFIFYRLPSLP
jgi:hypothetical protein